MTATPRYRNVDVKSDDTIDVTHRRQSLVDAYNDAVSLSRHLISAQPVTHGSEIHCHIVKVIGELGYQLDQMEAFDKLIDRRKG